MDALSEYIEKTVLEQERDLRKRLSALSTEEHGKYKIYKLHYELDEVLILCRSALDTGELAIGRIRDIFYNVEDSLLRSRSLLLF